MAHTIIEHEIIKREVSAAKEVTIIGDVKVTHDEHVALSEVLVNNKKADRGISIIRSDMGLKEYTKTYGKSEDDYVSDRKHAERILEVIFPDKYEKTYEAKLFEDYDEIIADLRSMAKNLTLKANERSKAMDGMLKAMGMKTKLAETVALVADKNQRDLNEATDCVKSAVSYMMTEMLTTVVKFADKKYTLEDIEPHIVEQVGKFYTTNIEGKSFAKRMK